MKARFGEENNLRWATRMENAGVKIVYSMPDLKVHAKIALIKREYREIQAQGTSNQYYAYLGTGNFNEKTATIYADLALLTTDDGLTKDLKQVFKYLYKRKEMSQIKHLLVAPVSLKASLLSYIDREIALARQGKVAEITLKLNALEDKEIIDKLYEASQAGVKITVIVRGICCLRPQVPRLSDNITLVRIVDRFLEHARVYVFRNDGDEKMYLASADWMERSLHRRVEVVFPVYNQSIRAQVQKMLDIQLRDNQQAVTLDQNMSNRPIKNRRKNIRSQWEIYRWLANQEKQ